MIEKIRHYEGGKVIGYRLGNNYLLKHYTTHRWGEENDYLWYISKGRICRFTDYEFMMQTSEDMAVEPIASYKEGIARLKELEMHFNN